MFLMLTGSSLYVFPAWWAKDPSKHPVVSIFDSFSECPKYRSYCTEEHQVLC